MTRASQSSYRRVSSLCLWACCIVLSVLARDSVGHQGLFAERLDAVTTADPLDAGSRVAWHNRNRTFLPDLGRFAQRDPNETGQAARATLNMHGTAFHNAASAPAPPPTTTRSAPSAAGRTSTRPCGRSGWMRRGGSSARRSAER
ncbi:MAG: hypothetical protein KIT54_09150 [Phycisphaeraceae bacterium]|nr:hypothetical protein [Phycisphaeraceae bacterium]